MSDRLLVLVRHGESEWNLKNLFTGWKDPDLTEKGIAEARDAGQKLKAQGLSFDIAFTSVLRRLAIASIGVPGSESSAVNSQRSASGSSKPQSRSKVRVPHRPLTIWWPSRKAAGTASVPSGRVTARSLRSRSSCFTRPTGMPSWPATSGSDSHSPTRASVAGSICATQPMSHAGGSSKHPSSTRNERLSIAISRPASLASREDGLLDGDSGVGETGGVYRGGGGDKTATLKHVAGAVDGQDGD